MAGVDRITEEILQEAKAGAQELLGEAKKKAEAVTEQAREEASKIVESGEKEAAALLQQQEERAHSSAAMRLKQAMLAAKQEVIDDIIGKAYEKLAGQEADGYFGMVVALLKKNIHAGDGVICFSKEDLQRLPAGFEKVAGKVASEAGGSLTVDPVPEEPVVLITSNYHMDRASQTAASAGFTRILRRPAPSSVLHFGANVMWEAVLELNELTLKQE